MNETPMRMVLPAARATVLIAAISLISACTSSSLETLEISPNAGGKTNDPAAGFANVRPGSEEDFILSVGRRTFFDKGSAEIDSTARVTLDKQIGFLNRHTQWYAKIQGFADDPGGRSRIRKLSKQRADAVMNYLIAGGIDPRRLWSRGYGKERIVRECGERACQVQNRRVITNLRDTRDE